MSAPSRLKVIAGVSAAAFAAACYLWRGAKVQNCRSVLPPRDPAEVDAEAKIPQNDEKASFQAYAAKSKGGALEPWTYSPRPLGPRDITIKITHCGVCHSDLHTLNSGWAESTYPLVVGHEIVGIVTERGDNAPHNLGDRVGVGPQVWGCLLKSCRDCANGDENCCSQVVFCYNDMFPNGARSYGGYAQQVRVLGDFAVKIPVGFSSEHAAPMLCAGGTVWAPLVEHGVRPGQRVAVTGIGGLGHLALQFANKLGAHVTAISSSQSKKDDAMKLGAHEFVDSRDHKAMRAVNRSFDVVLVTAVYKGMDWDSLLKLCSVRGKLIIVALPEENASFNVFNICNDKIHIVGSMIASIGELRQMFDFAVLHGIRPITERFPMSKCNEAIGKVVKNDIRFRAVLENL